MSGSYFFHCFMFLIAFCVIAKASKKFHFFFCSIFVILREHLHFFFSVRFPGVFLFLQAFIQYFSKLSTTLMQNFAVLNKIDSTHAKQRCFWGQIVEFIPCKWPHSDVILFLEMQWWMSRCIADFLYHRNEGCLTFVVLDKQVGWSFWLDAIVRVRIAREFYYVEGGCLTWAEKGEER